MTAVSIHQMTEEDATLFVGLQKVLALLSEERQRAGNDFTGFGESVEYILAKKNEIKRKYLKSQS